jgi:membrane protein YdbS with pleckstrin-like domain
MPLVTCPDCGGSVSTAATSCPRCGHPLDPAARLAAPRPEATAERELWQGTPSAKALLGAIVGATLFSAVVCAAVYFAYRPLLTLLSGMSPQLGEDLERHRQTVWLIALGLVAVVVGGRMARLAWRLAVLKSHRYRITDQRMVIESGVLSRRIDELDMRTVEDLDFRQSVLERVLGIGDITVISSDRTDARTRLVGIARPRELRELLRNTAYQATHRQLFTRQT